jgi:hypothetical protein
MMKKYRRRPVEVEAVQWLVTKTPADDAKPIVDYINSNGGKAHFLYDYDSAVVYHPFIVIETLEGSMKASVGDYICRGLAGEYWPVKPHVFEKTNEPVTDGVPHGTPAITIKEHD